MSLSQKQQEILQEVDGSGLIYPYDKQICPGLHFCPDWDGLPICEDGSEWESCTCAIKKGN